MAKRFLVLLGLLSLCAWSVLRLTQTPVVVPATSSDTVFSAERAMRHVEQIAAQPHAIGMSDHDRVRDYIVAQLTGYGLRPQVQTTTAVGTRYASAGRVQNIVAWMPGSDSKGKAVLVVAHYDGVEASPAAGDDAAASAGILETVRALRAGKKPLAHDVIVLFTDGEEAGLIGAAAFVREHPWAKDVAVVLNFEARGTSGRSLMFETGPGDLASVSALRRAGDATAGSVFTSIYRLLSNDTDFSELAQLGTPGLNFAFTVGVERYHTSHDDIRHLNPGSVQHHGNQMLGLVRILANEPLPLPKTTDAVFFDLPFVGLIVYPIVLALPLAFLALGLTAAVVWRERLGALPGFVATLVAVPIAAIVARLVAGWIRALHTHLPWGGIPEWSGVYGAAVALLALAIGLGAFTIAKRWSTDSGIQTGALVVWASLAVLLSVVGPGTSYLFTWPALLTALAELMPKRARPFARWIAAGFTLLLLVGFTYGTSVIMLGVIGTGATVLGALTVLVAMLVSPLLAQVGDNSTAYGAGLVATLALFVAIVGVVVVRRTPAHPTRTALAYLQHADSTDAWLGAQSQFNDPWTRSAIGPAGSEPIWTSRVWNTGSFVGRKVARTSIEFPRADLVRDTLLNGMRRLVLRVHAPSGAVSLTMRALGAPVATASIDGRVVDMTRYRTHWRDWTMQYWAVPDSGAIVALSIPVGKTIDFELISRRPGLPTIPRVTVPPRPENVVPSQTGDATFAYKRVKF